MCSYCPVQYSKDTSTITVLTFFLLLFSFVHVELMTVLSLLYLVWPLLLSVKKGNINTYSWHLWKQNAWAWNLLTMSLEEVFYAGLYAFSSSSPLPQAQYDWHLLHKVLCTSVCTFLQAISSMQSQTLLSEDLTYLPENLKKKNLGTCF